MRRARDRRWWLAACSMPWLATATYGYNSEIFWDDFEAGDLCAWTNPALVAGHESETFDQRSNDDSANAEAVSRCALIEGTIGDPSGADYDTDFYAFQVFGPTLIRVRLERIGAGSGFQPTFAVFRSDDQYFADSPPGVPEIDPAAVERQVFLPEPGFTLLDSGATSVPEGGVWILQVDDERNFTGASPPYGGVGDTYRLTLGVDPLVANQPLSFPVTDEPVQMPSDGSILIYRIDGSSIASLTLAETKIDRFTPQSSDLDTKLYLVRLDGMSPTTIEGSDDFEPGVEWDSKLDPTALSAAPHFVVVDFFSKFVSAAVDFSLTLQYPYLIDP